MTALNAAKIAAAGAAAGAVKIVVVVRTPVISYAVPAVRMTIMVMGIISVGAILYWEPFLGGYGGFLLRCGTSLHTYSGKCFYCTFIFYEWM